MKSLRNNFLIHKNFLTATTINLFYCCDKLIILMNIWMIGKNLMKHRSLKKKIFAVTEIWKILSMRMMHMQKEFVFKIKKLREHHGLYVQSDTLFLADVFENFRSMCLEIYELDLAKFLSRPGLEWQEAFKNTKVKLDINMLLIAEKVLEEEFITVVIYRYEKVNNKYMKDYHKNKEPLYIQYWDVNNL